jgi:hypothetical protein
MFFSVFAMEMDVVWFFSDFILLSKLFVTYNLHKFIRKILFFFPDVLV